MIKEFVKAEKRVGEGFLRDFAWRKQEEWPISIGHSRRKEELTFILRCYQRERGSSRQA